MKRFLLSMALLAALGIPTLAQQQAVVLPQQASPLHEVAGIFYAPAYATWRAAIISGNPSTGSGQSIIVAGTASGGIVLQDGTTLPMATVFSTSVPIFIQDESNSGNSETVTPSAVSVGACPGGNVGSGTQCATITGTFNYSHGASAFVVSGDSGIEEAITDAGTQGGGLVSWLVDTGNVTLNTGGLTTTTTTFVPSQFINFGASARVETTITTSANWSVGIASHTAQFCSSDSTLTAGTTCIATQVAPAVVGTSTALTAVLFTMGTSDPGAGAIKARVWGFTPVQASF